LVQPKDVAMTAPSAILGPPPEALDGALSGMVRLYRHWDLDDEERQSRGYAANQITDAQLRVLTLVMAWLRPAVDAERERRQPRAAEERVDAESKEWAHLLAVTAPGTLLGYATPDGTNVGDWVAEEL
jgi:hypothetical protein